MEEYNEPTKEREPREMDTHEENRLIAEHALLVARRARESDVVTHKEITDRLREIEQELNLSGQQIALRAVQLYKKQY